MTAIVLIAALDVPSYVSNSTTGSSAATRSATADPRTRLTDPGSNGRVDQWKVAII